MTTTKVQPILFSAPMIRALLAGTKTQTRRTLKPQPDPPPRFDGRIGFSYMTPARHYEMRGWTPEDGPLMRHRPLKYCDGDTLWVKEAFCVDQHEWHPEHNPKGLHYRATCECGIEGVDDGDGYPVVNADGSLRSCWKSPLFMPRSFSRLTLQVTGVRVQRLHEITEPDARAEGVETKEAFAALWETIQLRGSWETNPYVVAVTFKVHHQNVDAYLANQKERAA